MRGIKDKLRNFRLLFKNIIVKFSQDRIRRLAPEAGWVIVGNIGAGLAGFIGIKLLSNALGPAEFGRLALANTIIIFVSLNFFSPLSAALTRFWSINKARGELNVFYFVSDYMTRNVWLVISAIIAVIFLVCSWVKNIYWAFFIAMPLFIGTIIGVVGLRSGIFTAERLRMRVAFLNIANALFRPLAAFILVLLTFRNANISLIGYLFVAVSLFILTERLYHRDISKQSVIAASKVTSCDERAINFKKEILNYSYPFLLWGIFGWFYVSCDRWALKVFCDNSTVGLYSVVSQLAFWPLAFYSQILFGFFNPIAYQRAGDLEMKHKILSANKILIAMMIIYILGAILLITFYSLYHYQLVLLISNIHFTKYSFLLPILTLAWAFYNLGQVLNSFGMLAKKPVSYVYPKLVTSLVATISVFYFVSKIGPAGIIYGLMVAGIIYSIWCAGIAFRLVANK